MKKALHFISQRACFVVLSLLSLIIIRAAAQNASPYCNFSIDNSFGSYAYDNTQGNNFYITNMSVTGNGVGWHFDLVGGLSDAAKPSAGYDQGVLLSLGAQVTQGVAPTFSVSNKSGTYAAI